jgi:DNA gyrase inhibitor GyrI
MRHRKLVGEYGDVDIERGATGGLAPVWRITNAPDFDVMSRDFGAARVLGVPHKGGLTFANLREMGASIESRQKDKGFRIAGPLMSILKSNPYDVEPGKREYLTGYPIAGRAESTDGFQLERLPGGMHILVVSSGPLIDLEKGFGFLFGRFLAARGYELARPEDPEVRQLYLKSPLACETEDELMVEIAVPVSIMMRTDTMQNQR